MWRCPNCYGAKSFCSGASVLALCSSVWACVGFFAPSWPYCAAKSVYTWDTAIYLLQNSLPEQVSCVPRPTAKRHAHPHRTETHDRTEHDTNFNHRCRQLCGTMSWTAGRMEDNTAKRRKKRKRKRAEIFDTTRKKGFLWCKALARNMSNIWNSIHQLQYDDCHPHKRHERCLEHAAH